MACRSFGQVILDTVAPHGVAGPYAFFACSATGANGELFGVACEAALKELAVLPERDAEALLRAAGNHMGGDVTSQLTRLLAQRTTAADSPSLANEQSARRQRRCP